jgi:hypothetical protein
MKLKIFTISLYLSTQMGFAAPYLRTQTGFVAPQCTHERMGEVKKLAIELAEQFETFSSSFKVNAVACNLQLIGSVPADVNKDRVFDTHRNDIESACQQILNAGLIRAYRGERVPLSSDFLGACVSFVRIRVPE